MFRVESQLTFKLAIKSASGFKVISEGVATYSTFDSFIGDSALLGGFNPSSLLPQLPSLFGDPSDELPLFDTDPLLPNPYFSEYEDLVP